MCRKRTASVCKCCYETRPYKCPSFISPRNYLPTDILLNYTWSKFCSTTVRHRPGSILHPLRTHTHKKRKGSHQMLDFTRLTKHLQDLHSLKYQVLPFLFYLTGCFMCFVFYVLTCFIARHCCEMLGRFVVAVCLVSDCLPAHR